MRTAIRVDASSQIGTGHFMRCLCLADALKQRGAQIRFVCRQVPEHLKDMLAAKGHRLIPLDSRSNAAIKDDLAHAHWLGSSQYSDAKDTIQALSDQAWEWLVVDHYALDKRWESALRKTAKEILAIDDIADRHHDCDVLLDQNYYADMGTRYAGKVPAHCRLLLGPTYALLRDEFRQLREQVKPRTGPVKRVLVFFGGVDAGNCTGRTIEVLANLGIEGLRVDVVIGAQHPHREQIESACLEHKFSFHMQTKRLAELIASADLAIGAGGATTWERCCLGLPALTVSLANNQTEIAKSLELLGASIYVGEQDVASVAVMRNAILDLIRSKDQFEKLSLKAFSMADGLGVDRLCKIMGS